MPIIRRKKTVYTQPLYREGKSVPVTPVQQETAKDVGSFYGTPQEVVSSPKSGIKVAYIPVSGGGGSGSSPKVTAKPPPQPGLEEGPKTLSKAVTEYSRSVAEAKKTSGIYGKKGIGYATQLGILRRQASQPKQEQDIRQMQTLERDTPETTQVQDKRDQRFKLSELKPLPKYSKRETDYDRTEYVVPGKAYNIKLTDVAEVLKDTTESSVTKLATKLGVPTVTEKYALPERRTFSRGTSVFEPVKQEFTQDIRTIPDSVVFKEKFSPKILGKTAGTLVNLGLYTNPKTAIPLIASSTLSGIKTFRDTKVPTIKDVLEEQKPIGVSESAYSSYLSSKEGKEYKRDVERYVESIKTQRVGGLVQAGVGAALLSYPVIMRGYRELTSPIIKTLPKPKDIPEVFETAVIPTGSKTGIGLGIGAKYTPPVTAEKTSLIRGIMKKPPKIIEISKPNIDLTTQVFKIEGPKAVGISGTSKYGKDATLTKFFESKSLTKEIPGIKTSDLTKLESYISKNLPERVLPEGTKYLVTKSFVEYGKPILSPNVRLERISRKQAQVKIKTRPATEGEIIKNYQIGSIYKVPKTAGFPKETQFYGSDVASKISKSLTPRASGSVDVSVGKIYVLPRKSPSQDKFGDFIVGNKLVRTKVDTTQLAETASQFIRSIPKPKVPKVSQKTIVEPYVYAPTYTGGLGKGTSLYYGRGTEIAFQDVGPNKLMPISMPSMIKPRDIQFTGVKESPTSISNLGYVSRLDNKQFAIQTTTPKVKSIQRIQQPQKEGEKLKLFQVNVPIQKQVPRTKTNFGIKDFYRLIKPNIVPKKPRTPYIPVKMPEDNLRIKQAIKPKAKTPLFKTEVKRYGKWFDIGKPTSITKAKAKGISFVKRTLGASFRVKGKSNYIPLKESKLFRTSKKNPFTLVERREYRLSERGEVSEIIRAKRGVKFI